MKTHELNYQVKEIETPIIFVANIAALSKWSPYKLISDPKAHHNDLVSI